MTSLERRDLMYALGLKYLIEKEKNQVYQRENSDSYTYSKGQLTGACMALELSFEETKNGLIIFTENKKKRIVKIET